jgi:hypothetical protein
LKEEEDGWMDWFRCCGFIIIAMWEKGKKEKERKKSNVKRILNISKGPCCVCANNRTKRTDRRTRRQGPPFVIPIERHNKTTRSSVFILFFSTHNKNKRKFEFHFFIFILKKAPKK